MVRNDGVFYADLIGVPWVAGGTNPARGLDCKGLARVVLARCGIYPPAHFIFGAPVSCDADGGREALADYLADTERLWADIRHASEVGDIILSEEAAGPHVSVLVDPACGRALTTSRRTGVMVVPVRRIQNLTGYRRFVRGSAS